MRELGFITFSVFSAIGVICSFLGVKDKNNLGDILGCIVSTILFLVSAILFLIL